MCIIYGFLSHKTCKISFFLAIYAILSNFFVTVYALLCGEKLRQKLCLWRKKDKYHVWIGVGVCSDKTSGTPLAGQLVGSLFEGLLICLEQTCVSNVMCTPFHFPFLPSLYK